MADLSPRVIELLQKRYLRDGESPDELFDRTAFGCSLNSKQYTAFRKIIHNLEFMPSTPILTNSGTNMPSLFACFTLQCEDDLEHIMNTAKTASRIFKYGGGIGVNMSNIRPRGSMVRTTNTVASGAVSFLEIFNAVGEVVKQGSRRAAILASLDIDHDDIEELLTVKHLGYTTENHLKNMNISVIARDGFMTKVLNNEAEAREKLRRVCESIWSSGEPGLIFMDIAEQNNPTRYFDPLVTGNACSELIMTDGEACLTGDTLILTENGVREIKNLSETYVLSADGKFRKYKKVVNRGKKPIYRVQTTSGLFIKGTEDHKVLTEDGWKEIKDLRQGDILVVNSDTQIAAFSDFDDKYEMFGWMHGDGWYSTNSKKKGNVGISFSSKDGDFEVKERLLPIFKSVFNCDRTPLKDNEYTFQLQTDNSYALSTCEEEGFVPGTSLEKELPTRFFNWELKKQLSFMRGLFGADGGLRGSTNSQICLASSSKKLLEQVQQFLFCVGIYGAIRGYDVQDRENTQYILHITRNSANKFIHLIGFSSKCKNDKFISRISCDV
jgi:ribonucleoside-diphosphate reductase alpha chain